jgi:hypothetical protein
VASAQLVAQQARRHHISGRSPFSDQLFHRSQKSFIILQFHHHSCHLQSPTAESREIVIHRILCLRDLEQPIHRCIVPSVGSKSKMSPPPSTSRRHQKFRAELPTEWPEWRPFSFMFAKKHLGSASRIQTSLRWEQLMDRPIPSVQTTPDDALKIGNNLPLLQDKTLSIFLSTDNHQLAVYIPQGLQLPWKSSQDLATTVAKAIHQYVETSPPRMPPKDKKRYPKPANPDEDKGQKEAWKQYVADKVKQYGAWGVYHLGFWHAQGHTKDPANLSTDMLKTATRLAATDTFFQSIGPLVQTIGRLFQEIDPDAYQLYRNNYEAYSNSSSLRHFTVSNRSCFLCLGLLVNTRVSPHKDSNDVKDGWVAMACFGDFDGGELCLPALNCKVPFQPGDVVLFRSAVLEHWILPFGGTRYSCVFFTKQSTWAPY